jgi:asparagine synthase (glutamine-hydrolysing)
MTIDDALNAFEELIDNIDEPLGDSALIPVYFLSKIARQHGIKVLLNGAGGDEIFGGYSRHLKPKFPTPEWLSENIPNPYKQGLAKTWSLFQPQRGLRASDSRISWGISVSGVDVGALRYIIKDKFLFNEIHQTLFSEHNGLLETNDNIKSYSYKRMYMDINTYLPNNILSLTDKATMAASVEGRVPLLDHRLVEFSLSLQDKVNLLNGPKGLFKKISEKLLPIELLNRKKEGFNPPDQGWFGNGINSRLSNELLGNRGELFKEIIDYDKLEQLLKSSSRRKSADTTLYSLYFLNKWHHK